MLVAPGSSKIFIMQFFSIVPFGTAFMICLSAFLASSPISSNDLFILAVFVIPLLLFGAALLYIPNKYKHAIFFNEKKRILIIRKKEEVVLSEKIGLESILVTESELSNPGCIFRLFLKNSQNDHIKLFEEKLFFGTAQWESFAEKLSKLTKLNLVSVQ